MKTYKYYRVHSSLRKKQKKKHLPIKKITCRTKKAHINATYLQKVKEDTSYLSHFTCSLLSLNTIASISFLPFLLFPFFPFFHFLSSLSFNDPTSFIYIISSYTNLSSMCNGTTLHNHTFTTELHHHHYSLNGQFQFKRKFLNKVLHITQLGEKLLEKCYYSIHKLGYDFHIYLRKSFD